MSITVAQAHRQLVAEMDEAGDPPEAIAKKLGISVDRVEAILDQLDESDGRPAHQDDEHRAPAVEPVRAEPRPVEQSGPIVVGSPARAPKVKPVIEVRPVPEPEPADEDLARLVEPTPVLASRAAELSIALAAAPPPPEPTEEPAVDLPAPKSRRRPRERAVADALELAYGPGLSVSPAEGGVWVLRRAS